MDATEVADLLRPLTPQVLGAVVRRYGHFDLAEDATQEALAVAAARWPRDGLPDNPKGWLVAVAARRLTDLLRADQARRRREDIFAHWSEAASGNPRPDEYGPVRRRRHARIALHVLSPVSVGGLADCPDVARRRRSQRRRDRPRPSHFRTDGHPAHHQGQANHQGQRSTFRPSVPGYAVAWTQYCKVLYLIFNEGYASTMGADLLREDLAEEAIRLTRMLHVILPDESEVSGLLALMLLVHARHRARTSTDGSLVPMDEQDRTLWDRRPSKRASH